MEDILIVNCQQGLTYTHVWLSRKLTAQEVRICKQTGIYPTNSNNMVLAIPEIIERGAAAEKLDALLKGTAPLPVAYPVYTQKDAGLGLRRIAACMQADIDHYWRNGKVLYPVSWPDFKAREAAMVKGNELVKIQAILIALAELRENGTIPEKFKKIHTRRQVEALLQSDAELKQLLPQPVLDLLTKRQQEHEHWRCVVGGQIKDFYPTDPDFIEHMLNLADITPGMRVWEPCAGNGSILRAIRAHYKKTVELFASEISFDLLKLLQFQKFHVISRDMMDISTEQQFHCIITNFPFSNNNDVKCLQKAYEHLVSGGKIVAIMNDAPFKEGHRLYATFASWFESVGGMSEQLSAKRAIDKRQPFSGNTRLVQITKK